MTKVLVQKKGHIATICMQTTKGLNIFSMDLFRDLNSVLDDLEEDEEIRVIIITGEGRAFMAGSDIKYMLSLTAKEGMLFTRAGVRFFRRLERLKKTVIAAINGFCFGGGIELSLACDLRIAGSDAIFGQPEVHLGIVPGFNSTQRLPRLIGPGYAKELILTGAKITAKEAYRMGLLNKVVEPDVLMEEAYAWGETIAANSPMAVGMAKMAIDRGLEMGLDDGIAFEELIVEKCYSSPDRTEGMQAFVEKRNPEFLSF